MFASNTSNSTTVSTHLVDSPLRPLRTTIENPPNNFNSNSGIQQSEEVEVIDSNLHMANQLSLLELEESMKAMAEFSKIEKPFKVSFNNIPRKKRQNVVTPKR